MNPMIRIIIIEDIETYRVAMRHLLSQQKDLEVIADTDNGEDGLLQIQEKKPDVVVLDYELLSQGIEGVVLIQRIRDLYPEVKIVVDTVKNNAFLLLRIIEAGADAISPKDNYLLIKAIRRVMKGGHYFPPQYGYETIQATIEKSKLNLLTNTERQYFMLVGSGFDKDNDLLAKQLNIKLNTLKNIASLTKKKLGVKNSNALKKLYKNFYPDQFE